MSMAGRQASALRFCLAQPGDAHTPNAATPVGSDRFNPRITINVASVPRDNHGMPRHCFG
jgi:hypothetical protein